MEDFFVESLRRGDVIRASPRSQKESSFMEDFLLRASAGEMLFEPLRAHKKSPPCGGFFVARPHYHDDESSSSSYPAKLPAFFRKPPWPSATHCKIFAMCIFPL
jgi:hypothetical protein